MQEQILHIHV